MCKNMEWSPKKRIRWSTYVREMIKWPAANVWGMRWSFRTTMNWSSNCDRSSRNRGSALTRFSTWSLCRSSAIICKLQHQQSSAIISRLQYHQQSQCAHSPHHQQSSAQSYWASTVIKMTILKDEAHLRCWVNISVVEIKQERYISQTSLNLRIIHNNLGPIFMLGLPTTPSAIISMCMSKYPSADHDDKVNKVLITMTMFRYHSAGHQFSLPAWVTSGWSKYVGYFTTSSHLWIKNNDQAISLSW